MVNPNHKIKLFHYHFVTVTLLLFQIVMYLIVYPEGVTAHRLRTIVVVEVFPFVDHCAHDQ